MRWFKAMVDTIRLGAGKVDADEEDRELLFGAIEQCRPFVFKSALPKESLPPVSVQAQHLGQSPASAPFPIFSIEALDGSLGTSTHKEQVVYQRAFFCIETAPTEFSVWSFVERENGTRFINQTQNAGIMIDAYLKNMSSKKTALGCENVKETIKVGSGNRKRTHTIRKIVHVVPLVERDDYTREHRLKIDWSHRWLVRGHWRKAAGLGKDRNGDYCVSGFTWVLDHEKGPEHMPLVADKTRYVTRGAI